jgi:Bacterial protein of unknown function (DUF937)
MPLNDTEDEMAINLPNLVSQLITPDLINRIAAALGINPALAQTVVNAAIPAVLGAFASEASSADGAKSISDLISNQDPNMFDGLVNAIKGGDHANALAGGSQVLTSLLGSEGFSQLSSVLSNATGAPQQAAGSILGLVGPAVAGAIANQPPENWSDGSAVANLFAGEKRAIASALPQSLASALNDSGFLQGFETAATSASTSAASAASNAAASASAAVRPSAPPPVSSSSGGGMTWVYIIVAIIIVGGLAWYFLHRKEAAPASSSQLIAPISAPLLA